MSDPLEPVFHWLREARGGSPEALGRALEACRRYLARIARRELAADLRAKGGASDLVQEAFLEAHRGFGQFRGASADEFRGWLRRLLLNRAAKAGRRFRAARKRAVGREVAWRGDRPTEAPVDPTTPSRVVGGREEGARVRRAVAELPADHQAVLRLRYEQQLSFDQIGAALGRTGNAARLLWLRAVERLRADLRTSDAPG
jgi:RNA polymerase sigma-70 factor (ECF subfamily)